jgi:hypothetical protein
LINEYANEKIITANPRKVSMKDKVAIPIVWCMLKKQAGLLRLREIGTSLFSA